MPNKTKSNKSNYVVFYVLHLPILLLILGFLALSAFVSSKTLSKSSNETSPEQSLGYVLGDDEEEDSSDEEDENDDDSEDEERADSGEDEDENESEDDDDSGEIENEEEDTEENEYEYQQREENKVKTQERVQNSNGTYSVIKTESEGDKVKIETKTYDSSGKLVSEEKHEGSEEGFESETEDSAGNKLKVRVQDSKTLIKREGITGLNNFPLYLDENDGSVYVQTPNGEVKLGMMPQAIVEKAESLDDVDSIDEIELESESEDNLEFKLKTKRAEKLFGVFELEIPATVYFDAQNGEQLRSEQTFMNRVLSFFSF